MDVSKELLVEDGLECVCRSVVEVVVGATLEVDSSEELLGGDSVLVEGGGESVLVGSSLALLKVVGVGL